MGVDEVFQKIFYNFSGLSLESQVVRILTSKADGLGNCCNWKIRKSEQITFRSQWSMAEDELFILF